MARRQSNSDVVADRDVFDDPPEGPVGVHRGSRSWAVRIAPVLVTFLVAALVGLVVWGVFSGQASRLVSRAVGSSSSSSTVASSSSSSRSSASSGGSSSSASSSSASSASSSSSSAASSSSAVSQTVNKSTSIRVVNATGVTGYAARKAAVLTQAGYTTVVAANPSGSTPSQTVVWYENETDEATAQDVASTLGISSVEQMSGLSAPIVVVLIN